jgi:chromosome segregation ATPase
MAFLKDNEREQLRQLVKACLLEISKLKIELKKCQQESSTLKKQEQNYLEKYEQLQKGDLKEKDEKIQRLTEVIESQKVELTQLKKMKKVFEAATSRPKRDLTSFQTQIYLLLPENEDTLKNLYQNIQELGYQELTIDNFEHALRNLERKGYFRSTYKGKKLFWKKIIKD